MKININYLSVLKYLVFIFILLFLAGGFLYSYDSFLRRGSQLFIIVISFFFFVQTLRVKNNTSVYNFYTALLLMNIFGFFVTGQFGSKSHLGLLLIILTNLLPFYTFYYLSYKGNLTRRNLQWFFIFILPIAIGAFYFKQSQNMEQLDSETVVNNLSYLFVFLIPYVFLNRNKLLSTGLLLILLFFIIQGAKRGAVLLGFIGLMFFFYYQLKSIDPSKRFKGYVFALFAFVFVFYFTAEFYMSNEYLLQRLEKIDFSTGDGAGSRNYIYGSILDAWLTTENFLNLLFGFGFAGSLKLTNGMFAHNDWLELLSNFGLLGITIYLSLFVSLFLYIKYRMTGLNKIILFCIMSLWLISTLFSMNYISGSSYFQTIIIAYLVGNNEMCIKTVLKF